METQLEFMPPAKRNEALEAEATALREWLAGRGWVKAREICGVFGWSDRHVRLLASLNRRVFLSFPGSPGYRLVTEASMEEIRTAAAKLEHQGRAMVDEAVELLRAYHSFGKMKD